MQRGASPTSSSPADAPVPFRACLSTYKTTRPGSKQCPRTPQAFSKPRDVRSAFPPPAFHTSPTRLDFVHTSLPFALQQRRVLTPHPLMRRLDVAFLPCPPQILGSSSLATSYIGLSTL